MIHTTTQTNTVLYMLVLFTWCVCMCSVIRLPGRQAQTLPELASISTSVLNTYYTAVINWCQHTLPWGSHTFVEVSVYVCMYMCYMVTDVVWYRMNNDCGIMSFYIHTYVTVCTIHTYFKSLMCGYMAICVNFHTYYTYTYIPVSFICVS